MAKDVNIWLNTRKFLSHIARYKGRFALLMFAIFVVESTYVLDKYLFKVIIDNGTQYAAGALDRPSFAAVISLVVLIFAGFVTIRWLGKFLFMHVINRLDSDLIADIKRKFFNHIVGLHYSFHASHKTGGMISRLSRGGRAIESAMDTIAFNFAPLVFEVAVAALALATIDPLSAVIVFVTTVCFVGYSVLMIRFQLPSYVAANDIEDAEKSMVGDFFTNIDSIKYFGKERAVKERYRDLSERTRLAYLKSWDFYRWVDSTQSLILAVGTALLLYFPIRALLDGQMSVGDIAFIFTVYLTLVGPLFGFVHGLRQYYRAMGDFESLYYYDKFKNQVEDKPDAHECTIEKGQIEFKDVTFSYHGSLFEKFNLKVRPNERVALVGRSGSGKSTLVRLIFRLYDVQEGKVLIDGHDLKNCKQEALRAQLSIVPQECILFDDTIYNNIAFSRPEASAEEIWNAIKFAQLDRLIEKLPQKENTIVGERGVKLSGGEKQRVSIARALLADKRILVLDEATSSLDSETEHEIQRELKELMKGRTTIIIAHRLSTIMAADRIVVLEAGKVVQEGTHAELIRQKGLYKHLWELQKGGYIE